MGLVAEPWWVNLAILVPIAAYFSWRRSCIPLAASQLVIVALFAAAFGFVEATVVLYLRAAAGLLPGYQVSLSDVIRLTRQSQPVAIGELPPSLLGLEVLREAATMLMLVSVALLAPQRAKCRLAVFLWAFAIWDASYYVSLWATIRWPRSLTDRDILFLIPQPWFAPVWFPLLVCALTMLAVLLTRATPTDAQFTPLITEIPTLHWQPKPPVRKNNQDSCVQHRREHEP